MKTFINCSYSNLSKFLCGLLEEKQAIPYRPVCETPEFVHAPAATCHASLSLGEEVINMLQQKK